MGNALALIGCLGIVIGVLALIRGRMIWARIHSRKVAAVATAGCVGVFIIGAVMAAPPRPSPVVPPAASAAVSPPLPTVPTSTTPVPTTDAGVATPQPAATRQSSEARTATAPQRSTTKPSVPPMAPSSAAVTVVPADAQQAGGGRAVTVLATLKVKGQAPKTGYSRAHFGPAWTDDNDDLLGRNGCDTRNDILGRDLARVSFKAGTGSYVVLTGRLTDPYTAQTIGFTRGAATSTAIQIDHVVALGDAWQTGAQNLPARLRLDLANDPLELLAVTGSANEAKSDGDAATWLPPNKAYRCAYVARQAAVKARYGLWVTAAEHDAIAAVLSGCRSQPAPTESKPLPADTSDAAPTVPSTAAYPTTTPPPAAPRTPAVPRPVPATPTVQAAVTAPGTPQPPPTPTPTTQADAASGATALCNDGSLSFAAHHQGACSHHGGVATFYH